MIRRLAGSTARGLLWIVFPPLGWYCSTRARHTRRHRQLIDTIRVDQERHPRPRTT